jgi:glutamate-1-semialdehyde 2,1-aminomutase
MGRYVQGTGGNVSMLIEEENLVAVTPSQLEYNVMTYEDICVVDFDLKPVEENAKKPSIETAMHIIVYQNRRDVNSVVHTHQKYASIFGLINQSIPALFDEVAMSIGPEIPVVPYALSGSAQLADNVKSTIGNSGNCYILQNHGALALGTDIDKAKRNAELLEKTARLYYYALSTGKEISVLPQNIQDLTKKIVAGKQSAEIQRKESLVSKK